MLAIMKEFEAKKMGKMDACRAKMLDAVRSCLRKTEATGLEANKVEMEFGADHWEVPKVWDVDARRARKQSVPYEYGRNSLRSWLTSASDGSDIVGPGKGRLREARSAG
jgi:hypothetical protein